MSTVTERRFVSQLAHNEHVSQVFMASDKQLRPNRNGNLYLQLQLSDRSGAIATRLWNASENDYRGFENGDFVLVEGQTQLFQGNMQMIANSIRRARPDEVDESDFVTLQSAEIDKMAARLTEMLRSIKTPELRNLAECFLMDQAFMSKFVAAPAGMKNHHAYRGGLLEHVMGLMELVLLVAPRYPQLDQDKLLVGAFLHDSAKTDELSYERDIAYTDEGQLLGHMVLAISMIDEKVEEAERLSGEVFPQVAGPRAQAHGDQPPRRIRIRQLEAADDARSGRPAPPRQPRRQDGQLHAIDQRLPQRRKQLDTVPRQPRPQALQRGRPDKWIAD